MTRRNEAYHSYQLITCSSHFHRISINIKSPLLLNHYPTIKTSSTLHDNLHLKTLLQTCANFNLIFPKEHPEVPASLRRSHREDVSTNIRLSRVLANETPNYFPLATTNMETIQFNRKSRGQPMETGARRRCADKASERSNSEGVPASSYSSQTVLLSFHDAYLGLKTLSTGERASAHHSRAERCQQDDVRGLHVHGYRACLQETEFLQCFGVRSSRRKRKIRAWAREVKGAGARVCSKMDQKPVARTPGTKTRTRRSPGDLRARGTGPEGWRSNGR